jgi:membrane protein
VWLGAAVTRLLFSIGKTAIGLYMAKSATASAYGAAGSFVLIVLGELCVAHSAVRR